MKTNQLILAAALVVLAGCDKLTVDTINKESKDEIGFAAVTSMATKANNAIISGTTYGTDNTFQVWGWQSEAGDFSEFADAAASNFMSNLTIEWTKGASAANHELAWRNADHYYYWPYTGAISFLAVHPSTVAPSTTGWDATNDKPQATIADYTIASGNKTVDLMFATNAGTRRADALPMVFKHALSQIQFRARTNEDYSADVTFTLNSVTLNNIDLSGDLAYANNAFTWTDNAAQTEDWAYYATSQVVNYAASDVAADLYGAANVMIPQNAYVHVDADPANSIAEVPGTQITINYTMQQTGSAAITGTVTVPAPWSKVKEGSTDYDPAAAVAAWEPGKKYNYTLNFKLNEILFDPQVTDWVEVEMSTVSILD
ncbi:MAG: fimbrillin family protein [Bacteroidales bacterium]|nr:fimbrillin family protein [Bacteroidales bacterium]